ncbi:serine hydrolase domain-containing protein [Lactiplantibacillus nangangensis]|uniref:Serine hydrolase domain-containing protein n=1 Tax=Lactiplantibacillus nangangensis TaxID=2559917 RepID=A0ABW1SL77_9LACO|nr:serine hydrolase domain-containing protein [Lactiplantibacillus nangangensis]
MKRIKVLGLLLLGLIVIDGGIMAYVHHTNQVAAVQRQKVAKQQRAKRTAQKNRQLAAKIEAAKFDEAKGSNQQITQVLTDGNFVGTALVVKNNKVIYQKGFGYADQSKNILNGAKSKYQILSIQKSITAVCVMQLVQAGKLKLTDPVSKYYPDLAGASKTTLRQLLDMTTGYRQQTPLDKASSEQQVVDFAVKHTSFTPAKLGTFNYSSINFLLLAGIIRQETGNSYKQYFQHHIIDKLGLKQTGFVADGLGQNATLGYQADKDQITPTYAKLAPETTAQMAGELGTGQVYMSAGDLYRTESAILKAKLISAANVKILHTRTATGTYGGGVYNETPTRIRSHGLGYGYESTVRISGDGKNAVVLLSNYDRSAASSLIPATKLFDELIKGNLN